MKPVDSLLSSLFEEDFLALSGQEKEDFYARTGKIIKLANELKKELTSFNDFLKEESIGFSIKGLDSLSSCFNGIFSELFQSRVLSYRVRQKTPVRQLDLPRLNDSQAGQA